MIEGNSSNVCYLPDAVNAVIQTCNVSRMRAKYFFLIFCFPVGLPFETWLISQEYFPCTVSTRPSQKSLDASKIYRRWYVSKTIWMRNFCASFCFVFFPLDIFYITYTYFLFVGRRGKSPLNRFGTWR